MIDSIFNEDSDILKYLRKRQAQIKRPDKVKFRKPTDLEDFIF